MTETLIAIAAHDKKNIYGVLRKGDKRRRVVLHFHGFTHNKDGYLEVLSADEAGRRGFDHFRCGFYDRLPESRRLNAITLTDHLRDFRSVVDHFAPLYEEIYVSAHSLSGLIALIDGMDGVTKASLWDPSTDVTYFWSQTDCLAPLPGGAEYRLDYGRVFIISARLVEEIMAYPDAVCLSLAEEITCPTQFIIPEQSIFDASPHADPMHYQDALPSGSSVMRLSGADHIFTQEGAAARLLTCCYDMFET